VSLTAEYDRLFIDKQSPEVYRSMSAVAAEASATAQAAGLDQLLVELVNIRISQLNGCGFCLDLHVRRAVKNGETPQRLAVLPAWRDVDLFSPTEAAALALAETITTLPDHQERERDRIRAREQLTADQFSAVSWLAITMNAFNRVSVISGHPVRPRPA
jgi:AhpD family alkylhydroperoxidase